MSRNRLRLPARQISNSGGNAMHRNVEVGGARQSDPRGARRRTRAGLAGRDSACALYRHCYKRRLAETSGS